MIEGIKLQISSVELETHLRSRVRYHREREQFYAGQVEALQRGGVDSQRASNDPISSLEGSRRSHAHKAGLFQFMADHLVKNEIYETSESELGRLEIVEGLW